MTLADLEKFRVALSVGISKNTYIV